MDLGAHPCGMPVRAASSHRTCSTAGASCQHRPRAAAAKRVPRRLCAALAAALCLVLMLALCALAASGEGARAALQVRPMDRGAGGHRHPHPRSRLPPYGRRTLSLEDNTEAYEDADADASAGDCAGQGGECGAPLHGPGGGDKMDPRLRARLSLRNAALARRHRLGSAELAQRHGAANAEGGEGALPGEVAINDVFEDHNPDDHAHPHCPDCGLHGECDAFTGSCTCQFGYGGQQCDQYRLAHCERAVGWLGAGDSVASRAHLVAATTAKGVRYSCKCFAELEAAMAVTGNASREPDLSPHACFIRLPPSPHEDGGGKPGGGDLIRNPALGAIHIFERQYSGVGSHEETRQLAPGVPASAIGQGRVGGSKQQGGGGAPAGDVSLSALAAAFAAHPGDRFLVMRYGVFKDRGGDLVREVHRARHAHTFGVEDLARMALEGYAGDCSDHVGVWEPLADALETQTCPGDKKGCRQIEKRLVEAEDKMGCDAYAMADDLSWLDYVDPAWVKSTPYADAFAHLTKFARQRRQVRARQGGLEGPEETMSAMITVGGCKCAPIKNTTALPRSLLRAMLHTALSAQKELDGLLAFAHEALALAGVRMGNKEDVVIVGNSGSLEDLPRGTGEVIDAFGTVVRFNAKYFEELTDRVGHKRNVWVMGDYSTHCGCWDGRCCSQEQLASLRQRIGDDVRIMFGLLPFPKSAADASGEAPARYPFKALFLLSDCHRLLNYWLWQRNMMQPGTHLLRRIQGHQNLRSGLTIIFTLMAVGVKPTVVGFDVGDHHNMYPGIFHRLAYEHGQERDVPVVLGQYKQEPEILRSLADAGCITVLDEKTLPEIRARKLPQS